MDCYKKSVAHAAKTIQNVGPDERRKLDSDDPNGCEAVAEMKGLPMRTAVKTREAPMLERVRELSQTLHVAADKKVVIGKATVEDRPLNR